MLKVLPIILVSIFVISCAGTQTIPEPESSGARLYRERCNLCHGLPGVTRHTTEQWDQLLVMMGGFMKQQNIEFTDQEKKLIRDYLHRNAK
ncbi:MAG: cytochrome c [Nitrospinae bacterium]|nr:cytochrome c [Nitrospinota bacterium]